MPPELRLPTLSMADVVGFMRRHLSIISLTCLITWSVAFLYLIGAVPTFTAEADLLIESKSSPTDPASVSTIVESQIGIIKSESIARDVIQKLDLTENPEFVGRNSALQGMVRSITRLLGWRKPETDSTVMRNALESFQRKLAAKRRGPTYIVGISFDSVDPEQAARILNTVAEAYIAHQMDAKYKSTLQDETWIKNRLNELSGQASASQKALSDYYKNKKDIADADNVDTRAERARLQGELRELAAAAESSTSAYDNFRHVLRHMEATRQQSAPVFEASLITDASAPLRASSPKARIVLAISTIAGALLGIAIGMLRDLSDRRIRSGGQIWSALQTACITVVPRVKPDGVWTKLTTIFSGRARKTPKKSVRRESPIISTRNVPASVAVPSTGGERMSRRTSSNPTSTDGPGLRNIVRSESPIWTITAAPQSPFTESFLEIKLAIDSTNRSGNRNQVIGITSALPNEGKSTVAAALALLIAHTGARVVLLDFNLRNRSLSTTLAPTAAFGMLDVVAGTASVSAAAWTDSLTQLTFLPVGNSTRPAYASNILAPEAFDRLFHNLREAYEYVIVDLPAVATSADIRAAAPLLDSLILVVEWGRTKISVIENALKVCSDMDEIVLGVALNKARGVKPGAGLAYKE